MWASFLHGVSIKEAPEGRQGVFATPVRLPPNALEPTAGLGVEAHAVGARGGEEGVTVLLPEGDGDVAGEGVGQGGASAVLGLTARAEECLQARLPVRQGPRLEVHQRRTVQALQTGRRER